MKRHKILTWTARISGLIVTAFFLLFFIGEGLPDLVNGQGAELLRFLPFPLFCALGFTIAWWKPVRGGWLIIAGSVLMAGYLLYFNDFRAAIIYGLPPLLIGLCFLAVGEKTLV